MHNDSCEISDFSIAQILIINVFSPHFYGEEFFYITAVSQLETKNMLINYVANQ